MFGPQPGAVPSNKGSATSDAISVAGTICGIAAAVLFTPTIFNLSKASIFQFLSDEWGADLAPMLTYVMGGVECIAIYITGKLIVVSLTTWALMSLTRRFI